MTEPHREITATITDRHGNTEDVYAGSVPAWAWDIDRMPEWRRMKRDLLLSLCTSDPRGWRVTFKAGPTPDEQDAAAGVPLP